MSGHLYTDAISMARARIRRRQIEARAALEPRYDWYGDECECGKALGECRKHPRARPQQRPPGSYRSASDVTDWRIWMLKGGRAFGKSRSACEWVKHEAMSQPGIWVALVGATAADVRDYQIEHPRSGLVPTSPPWFRPIFEPSKRRVTWPNGSFATIFTAEEPEALRGGGFDRAWLDELAKWPKNQQYTWDMIEFALRELGEDGSSTRMVVSTTPRPTPTYYAVRDDPRTVVTGGPMFDNRTNLDPAFVGRMLEKYAGTRLGRQELDADDDLELPGALWTQAMLDEDRLDRVPYPVTLARVVVGVDPNAGAADPESGAEAGIVVAAKGSDGKGYTLADRSVKGKPEQWGRAVVRAYNDFRADRVVAEKNQGGEMVAHVIRSIRPGADGPEDGSNVPVSLVWATRGSEIRAEPVSALYEQHRVHHLRVGLEELERQMCHFLLGVPKKDQPSRIDRMDALVWAYHDLFIAGDEQPGEVLTSGDRIGYHDVMAGEI